MKVTPTKSKFGKYAPGEEFDLPEKAAKMFIKVGKLRQVDSAQTYQTRMMQAEPPAVSVVQPIYEYKPEEIEQEHSSVEDPAPYGYKADGTPRKRPGRQASD